MKNLNLRLDESNEVIFKLDIAGSEPLRESPIIRLLCQGRDVNYVFNGSYNDIGEVEVHIPAMKGRIGEGVYDSHLEVILEDKYFTPMKFGLQFEMPTKITAKVVETKKVQTKTRPEVVEPKDKKEPFKKKVDSVMSLVKKNKKRTALVESVVKDNDIEMKCTLFSLKERFDNQAPISLKERFDNQTPTLSEKFEGNS